MKIPNLLVVIAKAKEAKLKKLDEAYDILRIDGCLNEDAENRYQFIRNLYENRINVQVVIDGKEYVTFNVTDEGLGTYYVDLIDEEGNITGRRFKYDERFGD